MTPETPDTSESEAPLKVLHFHVPELPERVRVDRYVAEQPGVAETGATRAQVKRWVDEGRVTVEGRATKPSTWLRGGESVEVRVPAPRPISAAPEALPIEILYEDDDLAVVVKPAGMVTHPAAGSPDGTLVNALLHHLDGLSGIGGALRPGIVHRLDKETSGLLVVAKRDGAHQKLSADLKARTIHRTYLGLVHGTITRDAGTVDRAVARHASDRKRMTTLSEGGRRAVTHWRVMRRWPTYTLMEYSLETGRTHQIRVHMASFGHPIVGDKVYGRKKLSVAMAEALGDRHFLHAARLAFMHPTTGAELAFEAPLPPELERALASLKGEITKEPA